jgi:ferrous iron transport protein B
VSENSNLNSNLSKLTGGLSYNETVALVGPPNSGKTTLFNRLTGSKYKTVNYPGATVEYSVSRITNNLGSGFQIMDTPGIYSLFPKSQDEEVTLKALYEHPEFGLIKKVIAVVDATQMARQLLIVEQLKEAGFSVTVALTMRDLIQRAGIQINLKQLEEFIGCPVVPIDGLHGEGVKDLVSQVNFRGSDVQVKRISDWDIQKMESHRKNLKELSNSILKLNPQIKKADFFLEQTRKVDKVLLHPIGGLLLFISIMTLFFSSIFWAAAPFMDLIDSFFSWAASEVASVGKGTLWADFLGNGIITSFGAVLVFVPQIFILFLGISFLEGSGYLARAATIVDKPLSFFGLSGRSFVPLLSGYACAVPAIMSTRNISSFRDRLITVFIIPLLTCSARLPVYSLLLAFLFFEKPAWQGGLAMAALYLGSLFVGAIAARIVDQIIPKDKKSFFMMELPLYRKPQFKIVLHQAWTKTSGYVFRAGPPIFILALIVWVGTTFPNYQAESNQVKLQSSYAGQLGQFIEPIFRPMGVDWRVGVSLISAFAAREVFVSSLAVIFNVEGDSDESLQKGMLKSMSEAKNADGSPLFTLASVFSLLIFVMIALQCTSTTAIVIKEMGGYKFALLQLTVFNITAYIIAIGVYHILK